MTTEKKIEKKREHLRNINFRQNRFSVFTVIQREYVIET